MENRRVARTDLLLTPAKVAETFGVDAKTVTRWAVTGKLSSIRTVGGHRRYYADEVMGIKVGLTDAGDLADDGIAVVGAQRSAGGGIPLDASREESGTSETILVDGYIEESPSSDARQTQEADGNGGATFLGPVEVALQEASAAVAAVAATFDENAGEARALVRAIAAAHARRALNVAATEPPETWAALLAARQRLADTTQPEDVDSGADLDSGATSV